MPKFLQVYLLPALIFQSIIVAGGYGTGQELMVFFSASFSAEHLL